MEHVSAERFGSHLRVSIGVIGAITPFHCQLNQAMEEMSSIKFVWFIL